MRWILLCAVGVALAACGGGSGGAAQPSTASRTVRGPANLITEEEINASVYQNALEILQNLRPSMMRSRMSTGQGPVQVVLFVDDVRLGALIGIGTEPVRDAMMNIPAERVKEIRYISGRDATTRWGTDLGSGVILVTTKR